MTFAHWLVVISALIAVTGSSGYLRDTIRGKTKPNRVSWFMWALAPLIGTAAALAAKADPWVTIRVFLAGFMPLIVFLAAFFNRQSYWKLTTFDFFCGLSSLMALVLWATVDSPRLAIVLAIIGDFFATIPTLVKAWKYPETETGWTYLTFLLSLLLIIPSIPRWDIENSAFQIYLMVDNSLIAFAIYRKHFSFRLRPASA